ncbi:hypothetical protein [Niastella populi]|uniref:Redoxin domain-containing protein n=1 Tax=Niastella populi TaxID=550983 RepID=A0A1V9FNC7_9BACT|nr:hypothetical protein [Niastella populi]OQP59838.1 hypothetical protein A4R26_20855 [Niastella populi]
MKTICFFLILNLTLLFSCNHKKNYADGVKVVMPSEIEIYRPFEADTSRRFLTDHSPLKIYTLINTSCATCLTKLEKWDKFQSENPDFSGVPIIPICISKDSFAMLKFLFDSHKIKSMHLPLILDIKDSFPKLNNTVVKTGDFTALTDAEDRIIVPGDPIDNENVRKRFLNALHEIK